MRTSGVLLAVLLLALPAAAEEVAAEPDSPLRGAEKVLAAAAAEDGAALKELAERIAPDPWLVAHELVARGEHDAASAFAKASPRPDTEALPDYVDAVRELEPAPAPGEPPDECRTIHDVRFLATSGQLLRTQRRLQESGDTYRRAAEGAERIGWLSMASEAWHEAGLSAFLRSDRRQALACWERRLAVEERRAVPRSLARTLGNLVLVNDRLGHYDQALKLGNRAQAMLEALDDKQGMASNLGNTAGVLKALGRYDEALAHYERSLALCREIGFKRGVASVLGNLGSLHRVRGDLEKARDLLEQALAMKTELDNRRGAAQTLTSLGNLYDDLGDYARALDAYERAIRLKRELGNEASIGVELGNIGLIYSETGDYDRALEYQRRAYELKVRIEDRKGAATTLANLGNVHLRRGAFVEAIATYERALDLQVALGQKTGIAQVLTNLGNVYLGLGDPERALEYYARGLEVEEELANPIRIARVLENMGRAKMDLADLEGALELDTRSLEVYDESDHRQDAARVLSSIGTLYDRAGKHREALDHFERALALETELGNARGVAVNTMNIGVAERGLGRLKEARRRFETALADLERMDARVFMIEARRRLAEVHRILGETHEAMAHARQGIHELTQVVRGQAERQGISAREQWRGMFEAGALAAIEERDLEQLTFFLESGRAGVLLESLGGRDALRGTLPPALQVEEAKLRLAEAAAAAAYRRARASGRLAEIRERRTELSSRRDAVAKWVERVQREAKAASQVVYPDVVTLPELQTLLDHDEVFVSFALMSRLAFALVVSRESARVAPLGPVSAIEQVGEGIRVEDRGADAAAGLAAIASLVITPLGLPPRTRRVLVSPDGVLSYLPLGLLLEGKEVVYVPSGTTYALLLAEASAHGDGVLALGDPDYRTPRPPATEAVLRHGSRLVPLPASGQEAQAVGDVVLLGKRASETELGRAIGQRARWRALHLACHGLVDPERPLRSSLALSPDAESDGFLTCLETVRMEIPADLVVLSACVTARGKVYRAEGIVGLTRAFTIAGSPRVICSLWSVDDEATRALMVKFYELWNPEEGEGLPAVTALARAQAFVQGQERWRHPFFWAAWVLWGVPE